MRHTFETLHKTGKVERFGHCLIWNGAKAGKGYPVVKDEREQYVTRLVLLLDGRPLKRGEQARHMCRTPACISPEHLLAGTQADNERDKIGHGTYNHGRPGVTHCGKYLGAVRCRRRPHSGPCKPEVFTESYERVQP